MPDNNRNNSIIIRFSGVLDEKQNFRRIPGFTLDKYTERVPKGESAYKVVLQNSQKEVIASFNPDVNFDREGCLGVDELRTSIVEADIPLMPDGETIALLYKGKTIYEEDVIKDVPQIEEIALQPYREKKIPEPEMGEFGFAVTIDTEDSWVLKNSKLMVVNWKVKSSKQKTHVDILILGDGGIYGEVATDLTKGPFVMDMAGLSSSYNRIVVRVSNGFQSASMSTKKIPTKSLPPRLEIVEPKEGKAIQAYTPFDLRATIHDSKSKDPEKKLVWLLNGKIIQRGGNLAMASSLKPGKYRIEVKYQFERRMARAKKVIEVERPNETFKKWLNEAERF